MSEEKLRLKKLIEHWADHNDEHTDRFTEAAEKAAEMGLWEVHENLMAAANRGVEISAYLREALKHLQ